MVWIIVLICIVIVIVFWRIFLPLGIGLAILGGVILIVVNYNDEKKEKERTKAEYALNKIIENAQENATAVGKTWELRYQQDPASGEKVARTAYILSNDSLCTLSVQERLNGNKLTGLNCPRIELNEFLDLEIKFSSARNSVRMNIENYADVYGHTSSVYISSYQDIGYFSYGDFLAALKIGKAVAVKLPVTRDIWVTFSLAGSTEALNQLGKVKPSGRK